MSRDGIIADPKAADLIHDLIRKQILVKVSIMNRDYEESTIIIATRGKGDDLCFQIDPPGGLIKAIEQSNPGVLQFEFTNADRFAHMFEAPLEQTTKEIWLRCPDTIQRRQRRKHLRVKAPGNAQVIGRLAENEIRMALENISAGGAFCHCPNTAKGLVFKDQIMDNLDLYFVVGCDSQLLTIDRAVVRRLEGKTRPKHFGVAFEFVQMKQSVQKRLKQIIYDLQSIL